MKPKTNYSSDLSDSSDDCLLNDEIIPESFETPNASKSNCVEHSFIVPLDHKADRLDKVLSLLMPNHSRGRIQSWIKDGHVKVNGKVADVRKLTGPDDVINVLQPPSEESLAFTPQPMDLEIIASSDNWLVVNKPAGLVTHPGAGNWQGTLLNGLLHAYPELTKVARAGIVHRLDKYTSGLLVVARNEEAQTNLVRQLQERSVERYYLALVHGAIAPQGKIDQDIGRDPKVPIKMGVNKPIAPKTAITNFVRLGVVTLDGASFSLVRCKLETGRTHQIRVHLSSMGFPLVGDVLYGGKLVHGATRQMLHAQFLEFKDTNNQTRDHKKDQNIQCYSYLAQDMCDTLEIIGFAPDLWQELKKI